MKNLAELASIIARMAETDGVHETAIPRLSLIRASSATEPLHVLHQPAVCIVAQGRKQVMLGERIYEYDASKYLVVALDLPIVGQVIEASADAPYLCLRLDLDPAMLAGLMIEMNIAPNADRPTRQGMALSPTTPELLDAAIRFVKLLQSPADIAVLAPLAEREILYRLLLGDQSSRLQQIAVGENRLQQVNRAIGWIKHNYSKPFRADAVAAEARMSLSSLHEHFKEVTGMSPLQYQKQLRLQEARRLILSQSLDAAAAGYNVGYDSPSQFSREYSRLFGAPPLKDIQRLRSAPGLYAEA